MNWTKNIRDQISPRITGNFNLIDKTKINWDTYRRKILDQNNYTCRYCGGYYQKYLSCIPIGDLDYDVVCHLCNIVTHLNSIYYSEFKIYYSKLKQINIIRKTVDFIIKNGVIPEPIDIDDNIQDIQLSKFEFINLLKYISNNNIIDIPKQFKNYKIFFSKKLDIISLQANFQLNFLFLEDENKKTKKIIPKYNFNNSELEFIKKIFQ